MLFVSATTAAAAGDSDSDDSSSSSSTVKSLLAFPAASTICSVYLQTVHRAGPCARLAWPLHWPCTASARSTVPVHGRSVRVQSAERQLPLLLLVLISSSAHPPLLLLLFSKPFSLSPVAFRADASATCLRYSDLPRMTLKRQLDGSEDHLPLKRIRRVFAHFPMSLFRSGEYIHFLVEGKHGFCTHTNRN